MSISLQKIDAVLFDLDGTLLDSAPDLGFAANQMRIARGLDALPQSLYRPFVGTGARGMLRIALDVTPEAAEFDDLKEEFFATYEQVMGRHSQLFAGVGQLLRDIKTNKLAWGIVTNKSERFTFPIVQATPEFAVAGAVICGDTTAYSKPHPEPLLEAAKRMGLQPERCIYVGDDERDMIAARAAGMQAVAAAYGYLGSGGVGEWYADAVINSPLELSTLISLD